MEDRIEQTGCSFLIKQVHRAAALRFLKQMVFRVGSYGQVDSEVAESWQTLEEAFRSWRWEPECNEALDIVKLSFTGEGLGDDDLLFNRLGPFVQPGSYIEMMGEGGNKWRWVFEDGDVTRKDL